eukprot:TRINITY_DN35586_c0_g1_i1.p1 TRINITY_DN35586_c0_g1~~TRINITY_DN35586_c0_g1_i1.p1  ORF type:complete len:128 (-),score=10.42 TRINITY_DN35586_c0_g1_i1:282-665(-)
MGSVPSGGASLGGFSSLQEGGAAGGSSAASVGVTGAAFGEDQLLMVQQGAQGLMDYSSIDSAGGVFRESMMSASSFGAGSSASGFGGGFSDGMAASGSCLMDGGGSGPFSSLLDGHDADVVERLRDS